jgi:excisionase family DNA binding protein
MPAALAYTIREACEVSGIGRTSLYELLKTGTLRARKHGKRTLILDSELRNWLASLPDLSGGPPSPKPKQRRSTEARSVSAV